MSPKARNRGKRKRRMAKEAERRYQMQLTSSSGGADTGFCGISSLGGGSSEVQQEETRIKNSGMGEHRAKQHRMNFHKRTPQKIKRNHLHQHQGSIRRER